MIRVKSDPINKRVYIGIDNLTHDHKKAIRNAGFDIGRKSQMDTRKAIKFGRKTGRLYRIGNRVHQASAAGEAPAFLSGRLNRSVKYDVRGHRLVEFGYGEYYGKFLEDGTRFIKRRPNIQTVADNNAQTFINYMVRAYNENR